MDIVRCHFLYDLIYTHIPHSSLIQGLKHHIYARIIAFRATNLIIKTLAVVFERELFGFRHVGRLEHHAIAPVARLPK
jgi:hypothetical protein